MKSSKNERKKKLEFNDSFQNGPISFFYDYSGGSKCATYTSLEKRIKSDLERLDITTNLKQKDFNNIAVQYPINTKNPNHAHLILEHIDETSIHKVISIPIMINTILEGFKRIHISYDKTINPFSETSNIEAFTRIPLYFEGHDKSEDVEHEYEVGKRVKYLLQKLRYIDPQLIDIEKNGRNMEEYIEQGEWAAQLHDIGKIAIPDPILNKPAKLDAQEWEIIKLHSYYGFLIVKNFPGLELAQSGTLSHHETFDGKGYPQGLQGPHNKSITKGIPLIATYTQFVDIYDALISKRPYKRAYTSNEARLIMIDSFKDNLIKTISQINLGDIRKLVEKRTQKIDYSKKLPTRFNPFIVKYLSDLNNWDKFVEMRE